jgi:hypothetical protein
MCNMYKNSVPSVSTMHKNYLSVSGFKMINTEKQRNSQRSYREDAEMLPPLHRPLGDAVTCTWDYIRQPTTAEKGRLEQRSCAGKSS